jgi:phosphoribosylamine--glycine ligase
VNILFISKNGLGANIAYLLKKEGNSVKLFIQDKNSKNIFDNLVEKTKNWKNELRWVTKKGLIIFDDSGFGKIQDDLRKKGYLVFGGSKEADKLEYNRQYTEKIFKEHNIEFFPTKTFDNVIEAAEYASINPNMWVIKREKDNNKFVSYVGYDEYGKDVVGLLKNYAQIPIINRQPVSLQERIVGIEIGVGRYFNGQNWVGPIEINVEHPHLFPGGIGPYTSEMGTLAWYTNKENKLYKKTLKKLEPYLRKINFKGDFAINCIVNEYDIYALELTPRLGSPIIHLHSELNNTKWSNILYAIANGEDIDFEYKKGFGVVMLISVPPFPYSHQFKIDMTYGLQISLDELSDEEKKHIHFEEVSKRMIGKKEDYYIADHDGYILYVTSVSSTITKANDNANKIARKIKIPKSFYRNDIGLKFEQEDYTKLKDWGYL